MTPHPHLSDWLLQSLGQILPKVMLGLLLTKDLTPLAGSGRFSHLEREKLIDGAVHFCRPLGEGEMTATV